MGSSQGKKIVFSNHAKIKMIDRGASESEVIKAVEAGSSEPARKGRLMFRRNLTFDDIWRGKHYLVKQIAPVVAEENDELIIITVYVYYF